MYEVKNPLPEKFSDAILLAIADMQALAKSSKYKIDMSTWHDIYSDNKCHVCMAGAVLSRNFKISRNLFVRDIFSADERLFSFDTLRRGDAWLASRQYIGRLKGWPVDVYRQLCKLCYVPYEESPKKFYKWCRDVAKILKDFGY